MDTINKSVQQLLQNIKKSDIYKEYRKQEEILKKDPELKVRVDKLRADNFKLQNETDRESFFKEAEKVYSEAEILRRDPKVNAYLNAELAFCRMMQIICRDLTAGIEMTVPEL